MKTLATISALLLSCAAFACSESDGDGSDPTTSGATGGGTGDPAEGTGGGASSPDDSGTSGTGNDLTKEQYCEQRIALNQPWCDYIAECCTADDQADLRFAAPTCTFGADTLADCVGNFTEPEDAGVVWDGTWAEECLSELAKLYPSPPATCSGLDQDSWTRSGRSLPGYGQIPACRKMFQGTKAQGEACDYSAECVDDMMCFTLTAEATGDYQCMPRGTSGSKCILDSQCELGLSCVESFGERRCGELGTTGQQCLASYDCADGLVCNGDECGEPIPAGGECSFTDVCDGAYGCSFVGQTCVPLGATGAACSFSSECAGRCDSTTGTCVDICGGTAS